MSEGIDFKDSKGRVAIITGTQPLDCLTVIEAGRYLFSRLFLPFYIAHIRNLYVIYKKLYSCIYYLYLFVP